ncbi:uncharacterized protein LOC123315493 [Coccinella septempunctata]|uniref:uncharacterized protein LOC123315493 n=1 Tax=Coccinella septempunctata TaxID=41139 RepID=UPI001D098ADA|nr:uncharacterized protein LOC123315493 [Coccinella septempunctata]
MQIVISPFVMPVQTISVRNEMERYFDAISYFITKYDVLKLNRILGLLVFVIPTYLAVTIAMILTGLTGIITTLVFAAGKIASGHLKLKSSNELEFSKEKYSTKYEHDECNICKVCTNNNNVLNVTKK